MKWASEKGRVRAFGTATEWFVMALAKVTFENAQSPVEGDAGPPLPLNSSQIRQMKESAERAWQPDADAVNKRLAAKNWNAELLAQLTQLPNFILVSGNFEFNETPTPVLVHEYIGKDGYYGGGTVRGKFRPVQFNITFPPGSDLREVKGRAPFKGAVFGSVLHDLDDQDTIRVRAITVFK
jgi:hypothetical protein